MSEEQENVPPTSRLPRPDAATMPAATMGKATTAAGSGIPVPARVAPPLSSTTASNIGIGEKRKLPSSPSVPPPAKRSVSGPSVAESTTGLKVPRAKAGAPTRPEPRTSSRAAATAAKANIRRTSSGSSGSTASTRARAAAARTAASAPSRGAAPSTRQTAASRAAASRTTAPAPRAGTATRTTAPAPRTTATAAPRRLGGPSRPATAAARGAGKAGTPQSNEALNDQIGHLTGLVEELLGRETANIASRKASEEGRKGALLNAENPGRQALKALNNAELMEEMAKHAREVEEFRNVIKTKEEDIAQLKKELAERDALLISERQLNRDLRQQQNEKDMQHMQINAQLIAKEAKVTELQAEIERATLAVSAMKAELQVGLEAAEKAKAMANQSVDDVRAECDMRIAEIEEELRAAETIRRKLHNQVQELKGNIRVFARVRPALLHETRNPDGLADIAYGDERLAQETGQSHLTVTTRSESATGKEREQVVAFQFDKVFQPKDGQKEVFEEISMLAQSVLDGYNVCIFAYGQTGSGKSWTMEGGQNPQDAGMIPRAIDMIFAVSKQLQDRGWKYTMEGTFLEVYNEVINDLLGSGEFDKKKHEIKIDKDNRMTVTDIVSLPLSNPDQVTQLLKHARSRRAVAATLMNERSSRSHSVFSLKVRGVNPITDERSEGILNLVDLAGSERLASSGADKDKDRLKETININRSLSALADVISALGQGQQGGHVPYRNSTLTRLLQRSLSGSSKTLMFCNLSPVAAHVGETLCSLRFATKVNTTPAGTAKRVHGRSSV